METDQSKEKIDNLQQKAPDEREPKKDEEKEKLEFPMDMDEAMHQLNVPCKKVMEMENVYFLALKTKEQIEETVLKLQALTKVTWSVKQTRKFEPCVKKKPKKPITLFKRQYGCHMSTRTRTKTKKIRHKRSRNINCPAQLLVSIKTFMTSSKAKPKIAMFDKEFPCTFEFRHHHNHLVDVVDVLTTRPMSDDIKDAIYKLLNKSHSCASAYHTLYTIKVEEFGNNYKAKMADRHHFPRRNDVATIFKTHGFRERYDHSLELSCIVKNLEDILYSYQKKNGTLYRMSVKNDTIVLCICTPLMQRSIQQVTEILFIDPSSEDFKEYKAYFILTKNAPGALPISCILTNKHDMGAFTEGMKLFFDMIEIHPAVILTNGPILSELMAHSFFPSSKIMFSFYHALGSAWKALYETRHEMARTKKESYYQLFREVVFADSEEGLVVARQVLAVECAQPKFLNYIDKMYENIQLWCLYYRQYLTEDSQLFDYNDSELSFRLFRLLSRIPLDRTKLFNLTQMTDFLCSAFEKYYKNRILEMVLSKKSQAVEERYGRENANIPPMEDIGHHQYLFTKAMPDVLDEYYQVDMITLLCTCGMGAVGKHCEHVATILDKFKVFSPPLTIEQKAASYFIATGVLKHKNSFSSQDQELVEEHDNFCPSPESILGLEGSESHDNTIAEVNVNDALPTLETTRAKWTAYSNKILKFLENDPGKFLPAVNAHLDNVNKYSSSLSLLLKGLYAGFPYMGDTDNLPPLTIINHKASVTRVELKTGTNEDPQEREKGNLKRQKAWNRSSNLHLQIAAKSEDEGVSMAKRKTEILEHQSEINRNLPKTNRKTASFPETVNLNQLPNGTAILNGKAINFEPMVANDSDIFEIQKGIFVDQAALSQLTQNDVAVLDEKKGILIIPVASD